MRLNGGTTPSDGTQLGTLPEGYRPSYPMIMPTHNLRGTLSVNDDGTVVINKNTGYDLNNYMACIISFPV